MTITYLTGLVDVKSIEANILDFEDNKQWPNAILLLGVKCHPSQNLKINLHSFCLFLKSLVIGETNPIGPGVTESKVKQTTTPINCRSRNCLMEI